MGEQTIQKTFFLEMKFTIFVLLLSVLNIVSAEFTAGTCWRKPFGRGIGKAMVGSAVGCAKGFEMQAGICYSKCPKQGKGKGPMKGIGVVCWDYSVVPVKSVSRKIGKTACKAPLVAHQGLCYAKCPANTIGSGPVCWTDCSKIKKGFADCGAMCTQKTKCTRNTLEAIKSVFTGIAGVAKSATGDLDVNGMIDSVKGTHKEFTSIGHCKK